MSGRSRARLGLGAIFAIPAALALASVVGLVSGLIGAGGWDVVAWVGLGVAAAVPFACLLRRH